MMIIIKEGLGRERRVAMWYGLVYRLARAGMIIWNGRDIEGTMIIEGKERILVG